MNGKMWLVMGVACAVAASANAQPSGPAEVEGFRLAAVSGVTAKLERAADADGGKPAAKVTFSKAGEERRLLALEALPKGSAADAKALALRYRLNLTKGQPPRLSLMAYEQGGGAWFKVGAAAVTGSVFTDGRLALTSLRQTAFSDDATGRLEWDKLEKVWIGLAIDGPAEGTLEVSQARFTSEPYKPTQPLRIAAGAWNVAKDKAVDATLTTPNEGPDGKPCMKFEFKFPGGRHMYAIPSVAAPSEELDGYSGLRFTYKATLPEGIKGLLVSLSEQTGGQHYADPPPPSSADWTTITIPFDQFKLAGWAKDDNGKLDVGQIRSVNIGTHGTSSGQGGPGLILVADVQFVP